MQRIPVWLNPLGLPKDVDTPTAEDIIAFMAIPGVVCDPATLQDRYRAIDAEQPNLFAPPADERILNQLIWPLRQAKACYIVGNYLATIALSGIVAEMTAILIFELMEKTFNNRPMTVEDEKKFFGRAFEDLDQYRRIEILNGYGVLHTIAADAFGRIRGTRKRHLHLAQLVDREELARDARTVFRDAVTVVAATIGQNVQDGKLILTPQVMRYLQRVAKDEPSPEPEK